VRIRLNERDVEVAGGATVAQVRAAHKPGADVLVVNGAPAAAGCVLHDSDTVVLIARGEVPSAEDLEALMVARHTPGVHEKVRRATVGVAGLGGLGSNVAAALARLGVGRLVLADFDVVEPSNLNRQNYLVEHIGMRKVDATVELLHRINPYVALVPHHVRLDSGNVPGVFAEADVLVEAFDNAAAKAMIAEAFHAAFPDRPLVMASGMAGHASGNTIRCRRLGRNTWVAGDLESAAGPGMGLMAPRVLIAAAQEANMVLRLLLGETEEEPL